MRSKPMKRAETFNNNVTYIKQSPRMDANSVLQELFKLLEDYGPVWYTEEHHNRIQAALGAPSQTNPAV